MIQAFRPSGLVVSVESARRVMRRWQLSAESDVVGYRVFRAAGANLEVQDPVELTARPIANPTFVDEAVDLSDGKVKGVLGQGGESTGHPELTLLGCASTPLAPDIEARVATALTADLAVYPELAGPASRARVPARRHRVLPIQLHPRQRALEGRSAIASLGELTWATLRSPTGDDDDFLVMGCVPRRWPSPSPGS